MARAAPIPGDPGLAPLHLFTDAACQRRDQFQVSAWAAMLVTEEESRLQAGLLQRGVAESLDAELLAVAYSLGYFLTHGECAAWLPRGTRIIVHTDNTSAMQYLNGKARPRSERNIATVEHIAHLVAEHDLTLTSLWVRSHQGFDATCWRGLINARVDREARRVAREHRAKLEKAQQEAEAA